ncbi:hypothetical protein CEXT_594661 [Caerostris extrusa]|uniref:Uncharacterized protein n=1 Tax=Caerostris extrusa TaxID=172846 RepID=A0AAV4NXX4_CAEEX|nr:hypothetical protein CEXT_594661 [Caerostris extrusa]
MVRTCLYCNKEPHFKGFRPGATYSQGQFPSLNQLPGFLSPKGSNSLPGSDYPPQRPPVINGSNSLPDSDYPPQRPPVINGKDLSLLQQRMLPHILHILTQVFDQVQPILKVNFSLNQLPGFLSPKGSNSLPGSDYPPQRPPVINGKGPVFTAPKNAAAHSPHFNPGFRPGATYSQGQFPHLNQLPGFLPPKGSNSLPGSDYPPQKTSCH